MSPIGTTINEKLYKHSPPRIALRYYNIIKRHDRRAEVGLTLAGKEIDPHRVDKRSKVPNNALIVDHAAPSDFSIGRSEKLFGPLAFGSRSRTSVSTGSNTCSEINCLGKIVAMT
ncbi:uncharacterized protein LOC143213218 [Lasioglossum baleicum]|uniref:uncharacterized protein LOC143213218 n=1 Tax=Lasioglossum baleicum TaxID=434251 RepID=UPI003FCD2AD9